MRSEIIEIKRIVRPMRGNSQAYLVEANDGFYVAKFRSNPEGTRTLVNEWITSQVFQRLGVCTPSLAILRLAENVRNEADLRFKIDNRMIAVEPGLHLGSKCPVDPARTAMFDFLPRKLLGKVTNLNDFGTAFVVDRLLGKVDNRQAIFVSERGIGFRAYMIDHGSVFSGKDWEILDQASNGQYYDPKIYSMFDMHTACGNAMQALAQINEDDWFSFSAQIPGMWLDEQDYGALVKLFACLQTRISNVETLISRHLQELNLNAPVIMQSGVASPNGEIVGGILPVIC